MLSEDETREIEKEVGRYPDKRAACVEAMKIVQKKRGWVSDESVRDVAAFLEMSPDEIDGVATFYNLIFREPVGRHVILVCDSVSCWVMGFDRLRERLSRHLGVQMGETTQDGRYTLLPMCCLGACDHAPVLMVDDDLHRDVDPERVGEVLDRYP